MITLIFSEIKYFSYQNKTKQNNIAFKMSGNNLVNPPLSNSVTYHIIKMAPFCNGGYSFR